MGRRTDRMLMVAIGLVAILVAALVTAVLIGRDNRPAAEPTTPTSTTSSTPPTTAPPADDGELSPLTGQRVLVVKIDNVGAARPSTGLEQASLVYVEPVERGLSRLIAVFGERRPPVIGPVRSARETDLELLGQFGRPALAYSGSASQLRPAIAAAPIVPIPPERAKAAFFRDFNRLVPHNLYLRPERLDPDGVLSGVRPAPDIGMRFGPAPPGGVPAESYSTGYESTTVGVRWSAPDQRWLISFDGAPLTTTGGAAVSAATVVVQRVPMHLSTISDVAGARSPVLETVGDGSAFVLRDGMGYQAEWSRPAGGSGTTFTLPSGQPALLAPGRVWVLLVPE